MVSMVSNTVWKGFQVSSPTSSEKTFWRLLLRSSCPPTGTIRGFIKGHISITLIGRHSCSTNLQQIKGQRHREQRESRKAVIGWPGTGWVSQGIWSFASLSSPECGYPGSSPQPLISISIQEESQWDQSCEGREQMLNIKAHTTQ